MADNVTYQSATPATPPSATVISTEEVTTLNGGAVAAQQIQRVAVAVRTADGVAVDLPASTADGLLVNLGANNDVTITGSVTVVATNLDIRDLSSATDSVAVTDGGGSITVDGSVSITGTVDTELPIAAALADNTANPTVPAVGAFGMIWDGATWDRLPGTSVDGTLVNLGANNDVTVTGTVAVSAAALPLPTGAATSALQTQPGVDIGDVTINNAAGASAVNIQDGGNSITVDGTVAVSGTVTTSETNATTGTRTSVNDVATDVQLLASNASRRVATIFNDSTEILYLALGVAAASLTDYTAQLFPRGYFETPYRYTGEIRGIWANNASGAARVTELT